MGGAANAPGRRLLVVTESLGIGGTESHLIRLLRPLATRGWDTTVCCITGRGSRADQLEAAGIRVIGSPRPEDLRALLRRKPTTIALAANRLFWLLRRWRPQIVHFYLPGPYLVGAPLAIAAGVPIKIMSRRSLSCYRQRRPFLSRIEPALHRHMDAVIGNSRAVVSELESEGIASDKIRLIYNGIEPSVLPDRVEARRRLDLDPGTLVGLVVANLISYKGHTDLIEALGQISERLPAGWRVLCAGRDQGFQSKLERLAAERGVKTNVRFLGEYTDVPALLAGADFSVLSSWEEGFSNVILESMAARLPMIVTDVGGNPEAVVDGETGVVVPPHNPSVLGQAILRLACDAGLRDRLGGAGQKRVEQEFSIERCVASHHALYEELLLR